MPLSLILTDKNCTLRALLKAQYPRPSSPDLWPALEVMGTHYPILRLAVDDGYLSWLSEELGCRTSEVQHHLVIVYADAARIRPAIAARLHELDDMAVVQFADPNPLPEGQRPSYDGNLIVSVKSAVFGGGDVDLFDILLFYKVLADNAAESVAGEEEWLARSAAT